MSTNSYDNFKTAKEYWKEMKKLAEEKLRKLEEEEHHMKEIGCCICGKPLENNSTDYLCKSCDKKYGDYDKDIPKYQKVIKRKRYDDER